MAVGEGGGVVEVFDGFWDFLLVLRRVLAGRIAFWPAVLSRR